ncbi:TVG1419878 [Thermoplasma volcanium GSS1]|uniref:TVG1419878 protein n=1 Tax=Thermoplasma volcanium (strain ATCC 51530 / DSM 4299 / JCM 9571 / NBRC 15438 / GSS1) TaxID=273116 RepID=Q978P4_THEVO|nr:helix-turn-helix domain-containing protein [Thermoplasma volcanium]BAB60513.1 TVG1419878 [Thermoplasma volcanium GSS1]
MYGTFDLKSLPPSARLVLAYLRSAKISDVARIMENTGLSRRSVMNSVKMLKELGLIDIQVCLSDTRRRYYCVKIFP